MLWLLYYFKDNEREVFYMVATIVGMATGYVVSSIIQSVLTTNGRISDAQKVGFFTDCTASAIAVGAFVKLTKSLLSLG
jgi:hypothetical protein